MMPSRSRSAMDVVELGGIRLHILRVHPGLPHEADRVTRELQKLAPAIILGDLTTEDALQLRTALAEKTPYEPGFVDRLFYDATRERYGPDEKTTESPIVAAARFGRDRRSEFIPLRAIEKKPGWLKRRGMTKRAKKVDAPSFEHFPGAFVKALAGAWDPAVEVDAAQKRMLRVLAEGRAPVVAVVQAHRYEAFLAMARGTGRIPA